MKNTNKVLKVRNISKKLVSIALSCSLVCMVAIPMSVSASENNIGVIQSADTNFYYSHKEVCDAVADGMKNHNEQIDLSQYGVTQGEISSIINTVLRMNPTLYYISSQAGMAVSAVGDDQPVYYIVPHYSLTQSEAASQQEQIDSSAKEYLDKIENNYSDFQKAIIIHDMLAQNITYGFGTSSTQGSSIYDAIVSHTAICEGYTNAYNYLLSLVGVNTVSAPSDDMSHIWSKVDIDGSYYNVDVTFDDTSTRFAGHISHEYFLRSDNSLKNDVSDKHYGFDSVTTKATSTKYDNSEMQKIDTNFCVVDGVTYTIANKKGSDYQKCIVTYNDSNNTFTKKSIMSDMWILPDGKSAWNNTYYSLSNYNNTLYYSSPDTIYSYNIATGKSSAEFAKVTTYAQGNIFGSYIDNATGDVYGEISTSANENGKITKIGTIKNNSEESTVTNPTVPTTEPTTKNILRGDANGDNNIDINDVTVIQKYCAGKITFSAETKELADANKDGIVDINDATLVQKYCAGVVEF